MSAVADTAPACILVVNPPNMPAMFDTHGRIKCGTLAAPDNRSHADTVPFALAAG